MVIKVKECPFCNVKGKFDNIYMSDYKENNGEIRIENGAWIDYEQDTQGNFLWYAILCSEQYTKGHTLIITGPRINDKDDSLECIKKIFDIRPDELQTLMSGISKVANRLKCKLKGVENILLISLNEEKDHFHIHLIPRYPYKEKEKKFHSENCYKRDYKTEVELKQAWENDPKGKKLHGIWYYAYREQNFKNRKYWKKPPEERAKILNQLASKLQNPELEYPFEK